MLIIYDMLGRFYNKYFKIPRLYEEAVVNTQINQNIYLKKTIPQIQLHTN